MEMNGDYQAKIKEFSNFVKNRRQYSVDGPKFSSYHERAFREGSSMGGTFQRELEILKEGMAVGDLSSYYELGCKYDRGNGIEKDPVFAEFCFRKVAEAGYREGMYRLGELYIQYSDKVEDGLDWLCKAAILNRGSACVTLMMIVADSQIRSAVEMRLSEMYAELSLNYQVDCESAIWGWFHYMGICCERDEDLGLHIWKKGDQNKDRDAGHILYRVENPEGYYWDTVAGKLGKFPEKSLVMEQENYKNRIQTLDMQLNADDKNFIENNDSTRSTKRINTKVIINVCVILIVTIYLFVKFL